MVYEKKQSRNYFKRTVADSSVFPHSFPVLLSVRPVILAAWARIAISLGLETKGSKEPDKFNREINMVAQTKETVFMNALKGLFPCFFLFISVCQDASIF